MANSSLPPETKARLIEQLGNRISGDGVLIIDSRHGPTAEDVQLKQWLDASQRPVLVVANKVDKLKRNDLAKQSRIIQQKLGLEQQPIPHSSLQKVGRHQIWGALRPWIS